MANHTSSKEVQLHSYRHRHYGWSACHNVCALKYFHNYDGLWWDLVHIISIKCRKAWNIFHVAGRVSVLLVFGHKMTDSLFFFHIILQQKKLEVSVKEPPYDWLVLFIGWSLSLCDKLFQHCGKQLFIVFLLGVLWVINKNKTKTKLPGMKTIFHHRVWKETRQQIFCIIVVWISYVHFGYV